jgi:hypothetical protein
MNATMVASGTKAVPPVASPILDIPTEKIRASKTNARSQLDQANFAEFTKLIREHPRTHSPP